MTDINLLIKAFVNSRRHSREERKAAYELACNAADLYHENMELRQVIDNKGLWIYPKDNDRKMLTRNK